MMDDNEMRKYRKEHFAVEITEVHGGSLYKDEKALSVTHNGNQWLSISLTRKEAILVMCKLKMWLNER